MSIQRYAQTMIDPMRPTKAGKYVTYADHVKAVAEAEKRGRSKQRVIDEAQFNYDRGYEDARKIFEVPTGVFDEESYDTGYWEGYEQGYDAALANREPKTWPEIQAGMVIRQAEAITYFNQHGQGENP